MLKIACMQPSMPDLKHALYQNLHIIPLLETRFKTGDALFQMPGRVELIDIPFTSILDAT